MTAEITVMNRQAVALAADSAVSVETVTGGKVWQSAHKIFGLSRDHPVAVMIYGQAELLGLPWETLIKSYRDSMSSEGFSSVEDYADDLLAFIGRNKHFLPSDAQAEFVLYRVGSHYLRM